MDAADLAFLRSTYLYQPGRQRTLKATTQTRAPAIRELLQAGYSFLPLQYSADGCLFRGLRGDVQAAITSGCFHYNPGQDESSRVERAMQVLFLTHELSDAVSASALHEDHLAGDSAILVIPAAFFNRQVNNGSAAVLAIGDSGFVFRYPLLTEALSGNDLFAVITTEAVPQLTDQLSPQIRHIRIRSDTRQVMEQLIREHLAACNIRPATPVESQNFPA